MKKSTNIPFSFVLDELYKLHPVTKPMFGCHAVYVGNKIVMALRQKPGSEQDNGVWIATTHDHHESLRKELPSMRSIRIFGDGDSGWQVLPAESDDFEESVMKVCSMILKSDVRIGKIPKAKRAKQGGTKKRKV